MKSSSLTKLTQTAGAALALLLSSGCVHQTPPPSGPAPAAKCPAKYSFHYTDSARGFSLCLPKHLTKSTSGSTTTFTGFGVPAGTNLQSKTLVIATGNYPEMTGATAAGSLKVDGITLKRVQLDDGSAGHSTLHVIYTWQKAGQPVHFDFTHRAVNPGIVDPPPQVYDRAAQIKITEEIMRTFKRTP